MKIDRRSLCIRHHSTITLCRYKVKTSRVQWSSGGSDLLTTVTPALVDPVGRVPGAPPERPTAHAHPWGHGGRRGCRSLFIRCDTRGLNACGVVRLTYFVPRSVAGSASTLRSARLHVSMNKAAVILLQKGRGLTQTVPILGSSETLWMASLAPGPKSKRCSCFSPSGRPSRLNERSGPRAGAWSGFDEL